MVRWRKHARHLSLKRVPRGKRSVYRRIAREGPLSGPATEFRNGHANSLFLRTEHSGVHRHLDFSDPEKEIVPLLSIESVYAQDERTSLWLLVQGPGYSESA